jgi:predicted alpha/beta superfamily hydrolase
LFLSLTIGLEILVGYGYTYITGEEQVNANNDMTPLEGEPFADDSFDDVSIPKTEIG